MNFVMYENGTATEMYQMCNKAMFYSSIDNTKKLSAGFAISMPDKQPYRDNKAICRILMLY